jgi:hypothetical protein
MSKCLSVHDAAATRTWLELEFGPLQEFRANNSFASPNASGNKTDLTRHGQEELGDAGRRSSDERLPCNKIASYKFRA